MFYNVPKISTKQIKYPDSAELLSLSKYDELAEQHIKYLCGKLKNAQLSNLLTNSEDLRSQLVYDMASADWRFDPKKGCSKNHYRNYCANLSIKSFIRKNLKENKMGIKSLDFEYESECNLHSIIPSGEHTPLDNLLKEEEIDEMYDTIDKTLNDNQAKYLKLRIQDHTFEEIGNIMGTSKQNAHQIYNKAIQKLQHEYQS